MKESVNQRIKLVRDYTGLTQEDFAQKIGINRLSLAKNERGESKPRGTTLNSIIENFKVSRHWLNTGDGEMFDIEATAVGSVSVSSWSVQAHDALKAHIDEQRQQIAFLQEMLRKAMSGITEANFQSDIVLAAPIIPLDAWGGNIVRVAS